jgi:hypothetical protein
MRELTELVERLRLARVTGKAAPSLTLRPPKVSAEGAVVVDVDNGLADVDARLSLAQIARRLRALGYRLPLLRPLPAIPLFRLALSAPFIIDALVQRGTLISLDGGAIATPAAPRHAAGPSLLHLAAGPQPMALLARAHLRVVHQAEVRLAVTNFSSVADAVALVVREAVRQRAIGVEALADERGVSVAVLGAHAVDKGNDKGARWATPEARFAATRSLAPSDATAIETALRAGERVAVVPFMQRAAALTSRAPATPRLDPVDDAARAMARALTIRR